jgi:hypothetical protein
MQWFAALIPSYPDIQAKAHAELDRVVGRGRLPTVQDEKDLPYIHAIIKVGTSIYPKLPDFSPPSIEGGRALPQSILARYAACQYCGLHVQGTIHPKGHGRHSEHGWP